MTVDGFGVVLAHLLSMAHASWAVHESKRNYECKNENVNLWLGSHLF